MIPGLGYIPIYCNQVHDKGHTLFMSIVIDTPYIFLSNMIIQSTSPNYRLHVLIHTSE